ncbi:MAG: YdeI family protein [Bacteroidia bacterium]
MTTKDKRIDAYIAKAQPFAQPVMKKLRELVHKACPEVIETIKWGMPSFEYKGPYFGFAAFKQHCVAGFWKSKLISDPKGYLGERKNQGGEAMGNFGCMKSMKDLPPDNAIIDFLKQAKKLNDDGIKIEKKPKSQKELIIPRELTAAISKNKKAKETFDGFPPSQKREYAEWISEAKTDETKSKRLSTAIEWMEEGKPRNWKYMQQYKK